MPQQSPLPQIFEEDINLKGLLDIINPKNNLVLADDMMLSDAEGIILRVSENYERNFGFTHDSIVGKSAFDLEADGTFTGMLYRVPEELEYSGGYRGLEGDSPLRS